MQSALANAQSGKESRERGEAAERATADCLRDEALQERLEKLQERCKACEAELAGSRLAARQAAGAAVIQAALSAADEDAIVAVTAVVQTALADAQSGKQSRERGEAELATQEQTGRSGWLEKKVTHGLRRNWHRRHFTLRSAAIEWRTKPGSPKLSGSVEFAADSAVVASPGRGHGRDFVFELQGAHDTVVVSAATEEERSAWLRAISAAISERRLVPAAGSAAAGAEGDAGSLTSSAEGGGSDKGGGVDGHVAAVAAHRRLMGRVVHELKVRPLLAKQEAAHHAELAAQALGWQARLKAQQVAHAQALVAQAAEYKQHDELRSGGGGAARADPDREMAAEEDDGDSAGERLVKQRLQKRLHRFTKLLHEEHAKFERCSPPSPLPTRFWSSTPGDVVFIYPNPLAMAS